MTFSNFLKCTLIVTALLSAGCSTESNKTKEVGFNEPDRFPGEGNMRVKALTVKSTINAEYNDYSILTKKTFNFVACVTDPLGAPVQAALKFAILDGTGSDRIEETFSDGCLRWPETHSFTFNGRETIFRVKRRIESRNFYTGYAIAEIGLNPWADGPASGIDFRDSEDIPVNAPVVELSGVSTRGYQLNKPNMSDIGVKLGGRGASFQYLGLDKKSIEITPTLGLRLAHKYIFKISPQIVRRTISNPVVLSVISTGKMKVTLLILREDENPTTQFNLRNVLSSTEFEGEFVAGELTGTTTIKFDNIAELTSRTIAVLTLTPISVFDGFPQVSFWGPISPGPLGDLNLIPTVHSATEIHKQFVKKQNDFKAAELKPLQLFEKHSGFKRMQNIPPQLQSWIDSHLAGQEPPHWPGYVSPSSLATHLLCNQVLAGPGPGLERRRFQCRLSPQRYLNLGKKSLVDSILTPTPKMSNVTTVDSFRMTWSQGLQQADAQSLGVNFKAGASLGFNGSSKFLNAASESKNSTSGGVLSGTLSIGGDYATSRVWKKDTSKGVSASREQAVTAEGRRFEFDALVRKCFSISLSDDVIEELAAGGVTGNFKQFYCSNNVSKETRYENYYLVNSKTGIDGSPFSDNASNTSSEWRMLVRGPKMMNLFSEISNSGLFEFVFTPTKGLDAESAYLNQFKELYPVVRQGLTEEFPGFLSEE